MLSKPTASAAISLAFSVALLSACTTGDRTKLTSAVGTPLTDLNLVQDRIPESLVVAKEEPYRVPVDQSCRSLSEQIDALDEALGADLDKAATLEDPGLIERGTNMAHDEAFKAITRTVEGVVPFRSWVRKITGSERHAKRIAASIAAGSIRRAFLKGIRVARLCPIPTVETAAGTAVASSAPTGSVPTPTLIPSAPAAVTEQSQPPSAYKPTVCTMPRLHTPRQRGKRLTADIKCQSQPAAPASPVPAS
jgi:hypothetical protein